VSVLSTTARPAGWTARPGAAADLVAGLASLTVAVSALLPWMAPVPGGEGDAAHVFHGVGFLVLLLALATGCLAAAGFWNHLSRPPSPAGAPDRLSQNEGADDYLDGDRHPARRRGPRASASLRALGYLGVGAAEMVLVIWFSRTYRLDGDAARVAASGWYLAFAAAALTVTGGLVGVVAGRAKS
jgi:hypothetical protein